MLLIIKNNMEAILGLAMFYSWIHTIFIFNKEKSVRTSYENGVVIFAITFLALFIIGTIAE